MGHGERIRCTVPYGLPWESRRAGSLIALATGPTSLPGDGPGSTTRPGDLLPSITAVGWWRVELGAGFRDERLPGRCTRPRWWRLSVGRALAWEFPLVAARV